ncbi:MmgE/PrpD family protein [Nocardioides massiliensis]|uniref:2-methylcitrate dehydratase PrpD n=1 Tax=Nocardioides massiliensis TaxID=1325935 RepID=A0ABT9NN57_9ACTN|nr:MmgE/PrpD family protein [Nocardioides massiliensis]MDP9821823.1 2-methylcitrate dehydratase PrpD [Nocardioides massiliensis]
MTADGSLTGAEIASITHRSGSAPDAARQRAVLELVDAVACMRLGASHPLVTEVAAAEAWLQAGPHASFAARDLGLEQAVRLDALACHVDELDSIEPASAVVPAALIIPAALHVAVWRGVSGDVLVNAILAGYDVVTTCGRALGGPEAYRHGWWPSSTVGALGAAAAVGVVLALDEQQQAAASGIAAARTGGLLSDDELGAGHYLAAADASVAGMRAALLAERGLGASATYFAGPIARAMPSWRAAVAPAPGAGVTATLVKPFPCARPLQGVAAALQDTHLPLERVTAVVVELPEPLLRFVSSAIEVPDATAAAASLAHVFAAALDGRVADARFYRAAALPDPARLPTLELRPLPDAPAGSWGCRVHLRTDTGETDVLERQPPSVRDDAIIAKSRRTLTDAGVPRAVADEVLGDLLVIDTCQDLSSLELQARLTPTNG